MTNLPGSLLFFALYPDVRRLLRRSRILIQSKVRPFFVQKKSSAIFLGICGAFCSEIGRSNFQLSHPLASSAGANVTDMSGK
ncbi:hypothetical protein [Roseobacter cerasinus]|uniref:hypothetical protein n=1 Tax=Roseobacter cerasinus TaxID=2602289 RepID=UPI00135C6883|nr:hypothetical protein [Roseobacter cerasinus]